MIFTKEVQGAIHDWLTRGTQETTLAVLLNATPDSHNLSLAYTHSHFQNTFITIITITIVHLYYDLWPNMIVHSLRTKNSTTSGYIIGDVCIVKS